MGGLDNDSIMSAYNLLIIILSIVIVALAIFYFLYSRKKKEESGSEKSGGSKKKKSKSREQLVKDANKRLAQNPKDAEALQALADIYFNDGEWEKAYKTYSLLMEQTNNPAINEFETTMRHGISALKLDNNDEAYHSLSLARGLRTDVFELNFNLGTLEYKRKNYERAAGLLSMALQANPEHLLTRKNMGMTVFRLQKFKEAIELLKGVIDQQMDDKEAIFYLAYSYFELGQNDMAAQLFSHLRPDPQFGPQASLMAGSIHLKAKAFDDAQLDFEIGLKHKQIKKDVFLELNYRLAQTLLRKGELPEALECFRAIQKIEPGYKDVSAQIQQNAELSQNEFLKVFLLGAPSDFISLCRRLSSTFFAKARTKIMDIQVAKGDYSDILAEVETPNWEDMILFRYVRTTGTVGEMVLRDLYTKSKDLKAGRAFCICAGTYSDTAVKFVEARSIDLIDKNGLQKYFAKLSR